MVEFARLGGHERTFDLTEFLDGHVMAWGIFEDRFGRVRRRFSVELDGRWDNGTFRLCEQFRYDDGSRETRVWHLLPLGPKRFTATASDVVGHATGEAGCDSIRMRYRFRLPLTNGTLVVAFDDRIYRIDDLRAFNRARVSKWGVKLGEVSLMFERQQNQFGAAAA